MSDAWMIAIEEWTTWLIAGCCAVGTLKIRRHYLRLLARSVADPWSVTIDDLARFVGRPGWKPETRKAARSSVRRFYAWALDTGRVQTDPSVRLPRVQVRRGLPRPCPDEVIIVALARCPAYVGVMVMLAAYAGLRRAEIARVHTDDVVGLSLRVHGKGGRMRVVPLHPAIHAELAALPRGFAFPGADHGHLSPGWVGKLVARSLGGGWTCHTLRHRFLTRCYELERDIRAVQELAGHANLDTAMIYTKVPSGALVRAVMAAGPAA